MKTHTQCFVCCFESLLTRHKLKYWKPRGVVLVACRLMSNIIAQTIETSRFRRRVLNILAIVSSFKIISLQRNDFCIVYTMPYKHILEAPLLPSRPHSLACLAICLAIRNIMEISKACLCTPVCRGNIPVHSAFSFVHLVTGKSRNSLNFSCR